MAIKKHKDAGNEPAQHAARPGNTSDQQDLAELGNRMAKAVTVGHAAMNVARLSADPAAAKAIESTLENNAAFVTALELQLLNKNGKLLRSLLKGMLAAANAAQNATETQEG